MNFLKLSKVFPMVFVIAVMFTATGLFAQVATNYVFTQSTGSTYTPITGGTVLPAIGYAPNYDDDSYPAIPLGFTFNFNGRTYTSISIQTNGYIVMGNSVTYSNVLYYNDCGNPLAVQVDNNVICAFYLDIEGLAASNAELMYKTTGAAGSRVFTLQWKNFQCYSGFSNGDNFNFQIKLYESNFRIEYCYGTMTYVSNASKPTGTATTLMTNPPVGLRGETSGDVFNRSVIMGTNTWPTSVAGATNTATCQIETTFGPATGLKYTWDMPVVPPPPPPELFVADYEFSQPNVGYTEITGGTVVATGTQDDASFNNQQIGFTFYYRNLPYTTVGIQSNGFLALGGTVSSSYTPLSTGASNDVIAALGSDLQGQTTGEIRIQTLGSSPNRICVVQWKNWGKYYYSSTGLGDNYNFQIKLYESTNIVDVCYGPFTNNTYVRSNQVGLRGKNSADYNNRRVIQGTQTWLTSIRGTSNSDNCTVAQGFVPPNGLTFRWRGCFVPDGNLFCDLTDASGAPISGFQTPGTIYAHTLVTYPDYASDVTVTLKFYNVSTTPETLVDTQVLTLHKDANVPLDVITPIPMSYPMGFYRVEIDIRSINRCGIYGNEKLVPTSTLIYGAGQVLCHVWPGDVNTDGIVNYGDRKSLNTYIYDANLRSSWLQGYKRFKADASVNPFTYMTWEEQLGLPWQTAEGCYMDADGNGVVNNFDYVAIKLNWMRTHTVSKDGGESHALSFDMIQNFPNPFNPSTKIQYSAPEQSRVTLTVTDMLGRTVATLVNGTIEAGVHEVSFDGVSLNSGTYIATIAMNGLESGLSFSRTMKMQLIK